MAGNTDVLLRKIDEGVDRVRAHYEADLEAKEVSDELLYAVRGIVNDCRGVLDWTATAVKDKYVPGAWNPYFPLQKDPAKFEDALKRQLEGLATAAPNVAAAFERHQPYHDDQAALGLLDRLRKVNQHRDFTPQTRREARRVEATFAGGSVSWDPGAVTFGAGVSIGGVPVNPATQRPLDSPSQTVTETVYVDWRFIDPPVSVLPTLQDLARLVRAAVEDVSREAEL